MKKFVVLTSVLALAACFGGSGGDSVVVQPRSVVVPTNPLAVDPDSGSTMMDMKKAAVANFVQAAATVQSIYNNSSSGNRRASLARISGVNNSPSIESYTSADIDAAYDKMNDFLINGNVEGITDHDVLMSLALSGQNKNEILDLLDCDNNDQLNDKIQNFVSSYNPNDETVKAIVNNAKNIYSDFGKDFRVTLENARFATTSSSDYFTFVFENGKVANLQVKEQNGQSSEYAAVGGGRFETNVKGVEYSLTGFKLHDDDKHNVSVDVMYVDGENPSEEQIKNDLRDAVKNMYNLPDEAVEWNKIDEVLNGSFVHGTECGNSDGCVLYGRADYTDAITVESKGAQLGLKYSDFGLKLDDMVFHKGDERVGVDGLVYREHTVFAGGYEDENSQNSKIANVSLENEQTMEFVGTAFAGVTRKRNNWEGDLSNYKQPKVNYYNGSAKLTVTGTNQELNQKLVADFSGENWYKVTVNNIGVSGPNGGNGNIEFDGVLPENSVYGVTRDDNGKLVGDLDANYVKYYGPTADNPTEAVGCIQYVEREQDSDDETDWTFKADISFGTKKQ